MSKTPITGKHECFLKLSGKDITLILTRTYKAVDSVSSLVIEPMEGKAVKDSSEYKPW